MPYSDEVGNVLRVTTAFTYPNGQVQENTYNYEVIAASTGDHRLGLANQINSMYAAYITPHLSPQVIVFGTKVSIIKAPAPYSAVVSYVNTPGAGLGGPLPSQVRTLITWITEFAGVKYRGRTYLPTTDTSDLGTDGHPTTSWLGACRAFADAMLPPAVAGTTTYRLGVAHWNKKVKPNEFEGISPIIKNAVSSFWATQRRGGDYGRVNAPPF